MQKPVIHQSGNRIIRFLLEIFGLGVFLVVASVFVVVHFHDYIHKIMLAIYCCKKDIFTTYTARALVFLFLGQVLIVPIYFIRTLRLLSAVEITESTTFKRKILLTLCFATVTLMSLVVPYRFLMDGDAYAWRSQFAYAAMTNSVGLWLLGSCVLWMSAICCAATVRIIPKIWRKQTTGE